jgi:hypothetical protein
MALKYTIDTLVEVPGPLRDLYIKGNDGKFHLALDGHPDTARLAEFRNNNITLTRERDALTARLAPFDGIEPDAAKAALAKVAAGEDADVVKLKLQLAESQSATAAATQKAEALAHRQAVSAAWLAAGGRPEAVDLIADKVPFTLVDGVLKPKDGESSPTIQEWLLDQAAGANSYLFHKNTGGGASGSKPAALALRGRADVRILRNPSPAELGAASADIAAGRAKVEITT